jgi:hypothetical protein
VLDFVGVGRTAYLATVYNDAKSPVRDAGPAYGVSADACCGVEHGGAGGLRHFGDARTAALY